MAWSRCWNKICLRFSTEKRERGTFHYWWSTRWTHLPGSSDLPKLCPIKARKLGPFATKLSRRRVYEGDIVETLAVEAAPCKALGILAVSYAGGNCYSQPNTLHPRLGQKRSFWYWRMRRTSRKRGVNRFLSQQAKKILLRKSLCVWKVTVKAALAVIRWA